MNDAILFLKAVICFAGSLRPGFRKGVPDREIDKFELQFGEGNRCFQRHAFCSGRMGPRTVPKGSIAIIASGR